jgi:toxin-antitoxin system PIN domain toxin
MTIIDANLLLYAYNADAPQQRTAAEWLAKLLRSGETIGLPWMIIWVFIRICTNSRIWANPRPAGEAFAIVGEWLAQPGVVPLHPGPLHAQILEGLVTKHGATGPLLTDAVLAALVMEYGALLASTDQDFRRFPDLRWLNPLSAEAR